MAKITELTELSATPASGDKIVVVDIDDATQSADGTTKFVTYTNLTTGLGGVTDHGALTGLSDDDHTIYLLADGSRNATGALTFSGLDTDGDTVISIGGNLTMRRNGDNTVNNIGDYIIGARNNSSLVDVLQINYNGVTSLRSLRSDILYLYTSTQTESSIRFPAPSSAQYEFRINSTSTRKLQIQADHTNGTPTWPTTYLEIDHSTGGIGFFGVTPVVKQSKVNDPAGGGTVDAEARTAINAVIDVLEAFGFSATS